MARFIFVEFEIETLVGLDSRTSAIPESRFPRVYW